MTVWEIVIMMVVATLCVTTGIGFVYSSIVNTVERYQVRKTKRELEIYTKVMEAIPEAFKKIVEMVSAEEQKKEEKFKEKMRYYDKQMKEISKDLDE